MAAYRRVDDLRSLAGWLPVYRDQLQAQRSVSSMGSLLPFYAPILLKHCFVGAAKNTSSIATMYGNSSTGHQGMTQWADVPHWNSVKTVSFQTRKSLKNSFRNLGVLVIIWRVQVFSHKTVKVLMWQWVNVCTSVQIFNRQLTKSVTSAPRTWLSKHLRHLTWHLTSFHFSHCALIFTLLRRIDR